IRDRTVTGVQTVCSSDLYGGEYRSDEAEAGSVYWSGERILSGEPQYHWRRRPSLGGHSRPKCKTLVLRRPISADTKRGSGTTTPKRGGIRRRDFQFGAAILAASTWFSGALR